MFRSSLGLKVLGLCALVLGLVALTAGGAQAEVGAHWNIVKANGELVQINETSKLFAQLEYKEVENKTLNILWATKSGAKVTILCTAVTFDEGGKLVAGGGISLGRFLFTGCVTFINGTISTGCRPHTTGKASGELLFEKLRGLIILDEVGAVKEDYVKFVPDEGLVLARIEMGPECAIGELDKVEAKAAGEGLWFKDCKGNAGFQEEKVEHLLEEALHGLIMLGQPLTIDGSFLMKLAGEHLGLKWGGTPG